MNHIVLYSI